ncbi:MAG: hypothetical protein HQM16_13020 [Deltaproteobacteria bacterium]|nr:hypothetical protein [Deltaproteobacteria bacterium]
MNVKNALDRTALISAFAAPCILVFILAVHPITSGDLFMYLAIGREFYQTGSIPKIDPFIFSITNHHWNILHSWAGYIVYYTVFLVGSFRALILFKFFIISAIAGQILYFIRKNKISSVFAFLLLTMTIFCTAQRFEIRTSLFTDLFFVYTLLACLLYQQVTNLTLTRLNASILRGMHPRSVNFEIPIHQGSRVLFYLLPIVFLLWVNLHSGFVIGLGVLGCYTAHNLFFTKPRFNKRFMQSVLIFLLCISACLVNPEGWHVFSFPSSIFSSHNVYKYVYEFQPTFGKIFRHEYYVVLFVLLILTNVVLLVLSFKRKKLPLLELGLVCILAVLGSFYIRFLAMTAWGLCLVAIHLFVLHCSGQPHNTHKAECIALKHEGFHVWRYAPDTTRADTMQKLMPKRVEKTFQGFKNDHTKSSRNTTALFILFFLQLVFTIYYLSYGLKIDGDLRQLGFGLHKTMWPVNTAKIFSDFPPPTRIFNNHGYGSYLAFEFNKNPASRGPKIFFHGHVSHEDFYHDKYLAAIYTPNVFQRVVKEYDIGIALLKHIDVSNNKEPSLYRYLNTSSDWINVLKDSSTDLYFKKTDENIKYLRLLYTKMINKEMAVPPGLTQQFIDIAGW